MKAKKKAKISKKQQQDKAFEATLKAFKGTKTVATNKSEKKDLEAFKKAIEVTPDLIYSPKHKNSISVFLQRHKGTITQEVVCKVLLLSPEELEGKLTEIILKIQERLNLPQKIIGRLKDLFFPPKNTN